MRKAAVTCLIALMGSSVWAQDIHFSQFYNAPYGLNPSLAGLYNGRFRAVFNWKDQWRSIDKSFQTFAFSWDQRIFRGQWKNADIAYGLHVHRDIAGDLKLGTTKLLFALNTILKVGDGQRLSGGLQAGFGNVGFGDINAARWGNQYDGINWDPTISSGEPLFQPYNYIDFGAGITYWYSSSENAVGSNDRKDFKIGAAVHHINRPYQAFYNDEDERLRMRFVVHGTGYIGMENSNMGLAPSFSYMRQGPHQEIMAGMHFRYIFQDDAHVTGYVRLFAIRAGLHMRFATPVDAVIPSVLIEVQDFALGLSYDINTSGLTPATSLRGGFELSLKYVHPDRFYYQSPERSAPSI